MEEKMRMYSKDKAINDLKRIQKLIDTLIITISNRNKIDNSTKSNVLDLTEYTVKILNIELDKELDKQKKEGKQFLSDAEIDNIFEKIELETNNKVLFGLEAQGHIPTIEKMLNEFGSAHSEYIWDKIGKNIGWDSKTAALYYIEYLKNKYENKR